MSLLLEGRNLALLRGGRLLFEGLDLAVAAGEGLHLTGPNGTGKSSLIRLIAGLLKPSAGVLSRSNAALADDGMAFDRELTLHRALSFWNAPNLANAMAEFDIERLGDVPVRLLSTGQRKRATLARVMASGAPLWLLDEPLNGLDRDGMERLAAVVAHHRTNGGGVMVASHTPLAGEWRTLELGA